MQHLLQHIRSLGKTYPWFAWLFWAFFILYYAKRGIWFFDWDVAAVVLLGGMLLSTGMMVGLNRLTRSPQKSAIILTLGLLLFLFYGYIYFAMAFKTTWLAWMRHRYLLPLMGIVWLGVVVLVWRRKQRMDTLTKYLNTLFVVLIVWEGCLTVMSLVQSRGWWEKVHEQYIQLPKSPDRPDVPLNDQLPDIYHLMLDAHTSIGSLRKYWGYEDSSFVQGLVERGFFVAENGTSGYADTDNSMSAIYYLDYVPDWMSLTPDEPQASSTGRRCIRYGKQIQKLYQAGYNFRNLSPFDLLDDPALYHMTFLNLNNTTQYLSFTNAYTYAFYLVGQQQYYRHTERIIDSLWASRDYAVPTYTYAHFFMPHQPFYYDRAGNFVPDQLAAMDPKDAYLEQTIYTQSLMLQTIDSIRQVTGPEAIILLHGDHGFRNLEDPAEDMTTLFALYLPSQSYQTLHDSLNIVNSFRIINQEIFGEPLELLPHKVVGTIR